MEITEEREVSSFIEEFEEDTPRRTLEGEIVTLTKSTVAYSCTSPRYDVSTPTGIWKGMTHEWVVYFTTPLHRLQRILYGRS